MSQATRPPSTIDMFAGELDQEQAANVRVAAHTMDELERSIDDVRDVETRYWWVGAIAVVAFLVGASIVLYPGGMMEQIYRTIGPLVVTLLVVGFGLVCIAYGFAVRRRSAVDQEKFELNRQHFVPHNAYYFPPEAPGAAGRVVHYKPRKLKAVRSGPHDNIKPGRIWW